MAVGQNVLHKEGYEKQIGAARYVDNITTEGLHSDKTICICIPRGHINRITLLLRRLYES